MKIGIDGNMWYCSNGLPLPDSRSKFTFERTLRKAVDEYKKQHNCEISIPDELLRFIDCTPEEYKAVSNVK